jgi:hypothetical protein
MEDVLTYPHDPITDITANDLRTQVSETLGIQYLSPTDPMYKSIAGKIFHTGGSVLRCIVTLPVTAGGKSVATHFIFDTGSPYTFVSIEVVQALGIPEEKWGCEPVHINGRRCILSISGTTPTNGVGNILGMDFIHHADAIVLVDMNTMTIEIDSALFWPSSSSDEDDEKN